MRCRSILYKGIMEKSIMASINILSKITMNFKLLIRYLLMFCSSKRNKIKVQMMAPALTIVPLSIVMQILATLNSILRSRHKQLGRILEFCR